MGRTFSRWLLLGPALGLLAGCASLPIDRVYRDQVTQNVPPAAVRQDYDKYAGLTVIWGGRIIENSNSPEGSELTVVGMPLDENEQPDGYASPAGRFIAKTDSFLDPEIYRIGTEVTLAGKITGREERPLGKSKYTYPVIDIMQIVRWRAAPYYYNGGPYYYWPYPYWDWGWYWFGFPHPYRHFWGGEHFERHEFGGHRR